MITKRITIVLALVVGLFPSLAGAQQQQPDDEMRQLQERFKERFPAIQELKRAGTVGETFDGYVAVVKDGTPMPQVAETENADRRRLYALIAEKEGTTAERVARQNARRNFENARPGEHLRDEDGTWRQKE